MSRATRPLPPLPQPNAFTQSPSLDVAESSSSGFSTPSLPDDCQTSATVSVKFAPLPKIGPRERKASNHPLGIAARSRILQQRRDAAQMQYYRQPGIYSDLEDRSEGFIPREVEEEDPLEVLGRLIADKSKSLWRRATSKASTKQSNKVKDGTRGVVNETIAQEEKKHTAIKSRPARREGVPPISSSSTPVNETSEISKNKSGGTTKGGGAIGSGSV
ncbi:hypothetical protein BJV78DRAFT_290842 [Lactifluus subvellereus]|nr:hypothetical protein BJV78DRAFT_290842 [Lactifluus subvellereus]